MDENADIYSDSEYIVWEEFANVATTLLEKIEHFLDALEVESNLENGGPKTRESCTNISFTAW